MRRQVNLNRHLALETPQRSSDGAGGFVETWALSGWLWADVRAGSGRGRQSDGLHVSTVPYRIIVRAAPQGAASRPRPEQRLRDGSRLFRILAVSEFDEAGRYLVCHAREEVTA